MYSRSIIFVLMSAFHLSAVFLHSEIFSPIAAGSIYLPLMVLAKIGVPVFVGGESGGWASPSVVGWALAFVLWAGVWWVLSGAALRLWRRRNHA